MEYTKEQRAKIVDAYKALLKTKTKMELASKEYNERLATLRGTLSSNANGEPLIQEALAVMGRFYIETPTEE